MEKLGLIAGNGQLPVIFARAAKVQGLAVIAVGHEGETEPSLASDVESLTWVRVGQLERIRKVLRQAGVRRAVMAGGIGRVRALAALRPDVGAFRVLARLRSLRDDSLLRGIAADLEAGGIQIVAPTDYVKEALAPAGHLAGPPLTAAQEADVQLGAQVARKLGEADVGQTVVIRQGQVFAVEAMEGTDAAIRRGCELAGPGAVVVKRMKPGQDPRFDLPAVGVRTLEELSRGRAAVLAVQAGATILLDPPAVLKAAGDLGIALQAIP